MIWNWIKADDFSALETNRNKLIPALESREKEYLIGYYKPKEHSFCRAFTSKYPNLGVHSTQRNEKYHDVSGIGLSKNITVSCAINLPLIGLRGFLDSTKTALTRTESQRFAPLTGSFSSFALVDLQYIVSS
jgi:hypothetical protein